MEVSPLLKVDLEILRLFESGDANAGLKLLMNTYQEKLYWHIRGIVQHHEDAHDVLQNTFIKVYKSIHRFKGKAKLFTWLYRIATNESLDLINQNKNRKSGIALEEIPTKHLQASKDELPESHAIQKLLESSLEVLPLKQRIVFQLRYFDEMTYDDISAITGTSVGALKANYHHAVKKIESFIRANQE